jgi:hypothetical protein
VAGYTASSNFPTTTAAFQSLAPGGYNGFVARFFPMQPPPSVVSVSPASGSGSSQVFSVTVADPNGAADLNNVLFMVGDLPGACYTMYNLSAGQLLLANDAGTAWLAPIVAGSAATVSNSRCTLHAAGSSFTAAGVNLTANFSLSFNNGFGGSKHLYAWAADLSGLNTGWQTMGSWVVGNASQPPSITSVSPASGSGSAQVFSVAVADANGAADLNYVLFMVGVLPGACYAMHNLSVGQILLANDAGTAWLAPIMAGSAATVSNSRCTLHAAGSSFTAAGVNLTANFSLSFNNGFGGARQLCAWATDNSGINTGWQTMGVWTVP